MHIPLDLVQRSLTEVVDSAQTHVHRQQSRTVDEDPKFLMIYYDNDQFYGEDIYYLRVCKKKERRSINKLHN